MEYKVAVIGGGASGLVAAIFAARAGHEVTIFEHKDRLGKKIPATGNGKCNYANTYMSDECYRSDNQGFEKYALSEFGAAEIIDFFKELGIYPKERNGYIYPHSEQAASVAESLIMCVTELGVKTVFSEVTDVFKNKIGFKVVCGSERYNFDKMIICCGGKASPVHGSDGSGYEFARKLGHSIISPVPALVQLKCFEKYYKTISGVRLEAEVKLFEGEKYTGHSDRGEIIFTDQGVSGIPIFQISRFAAREIEKKNEIFVKIDFFTELSKEKLASEILRRMKNHTERTIEKNMVGLLNHKLNYVVLKECGIEPEALSCSFTEKEAQKVAGMIKEFTCRVRETNSFENAQVTAGGVNTKEVDEKTMQSKIVPGVYFSGEVLDVDGICGGYNLMWAWSSGRLAGQLR